MEYIKEENRIYLVDDNNKEIAVVEFPYINEGVVNVIHTEVDDSLKGKGIAGKLMLELVKEFRKDNRKAILTCSYAVRWFDKHPEYFDVLMDIEAFKKQAKENTLACGINLNK